jgi:hypothetical protein
MEHLFLTNPFWGLIAGLAIGSRGISAGKRLEPGGVNDGFVWFRTDN